MPRLSRDIVITEKIDGTNASIFIRETSGLEPMSRDSVAIVGNCEIFVGSRTRWITPQNDNYGFARWVRENAPDLVDLGEGHHFGEWWGQGIQRNYGLNEKRFSLFNVDRWCHHLIKPQQVGESWDEASRTMVPKFQTPAPACCDVVPVLYRGPFDTHRIEFEVDALHDFGSLASLGFMDPEGIIVYHIAGRVGFKKTIKDDDKAKGHQS